MGKRESMSFFTDLDFGFSYVGLVYLFLLFIPNILWTKHKPQGYDNDLEKENKVFLFLERIGEVSVSVLSLIFLNFNIYRITWWSIFLLISFILICFYEVCWIRYFKSKKQMYDFYKSFWFIPIPLAVLPILSFLFLGIYGKNAYFILAVIILGIGHIGIHYQHLKNCKKTKEVE